MYSRLAVLLRLRTLARQDHLNDRATVLTLFARFTDELCSGLLVVLTPTLRSRIGLSVPQVGWCFQALASAGALTEPLAAVAVDVTSRRPLLVAGAAGWGAALLLTAGATSFGWVLAGFALAGAAYGPLANTADVVLIEGHPTASERIASRSTALDTVGAFLAPAAVAGAAWAGADTRWLLATAGGAALLYAGALAGTVVPTAAPRPDGTAVRDHVGGNLRAVLADRTTRRWIGALLLLELAGPLEVFEPVWLRDAAGLSQALVAVHVAVGMAASFVALVLLDRWLASHDAVPVLRASLVASFVVYPAWLLLPGLAAKLVLVAVRDTAHATLWPIIHARALASAPGRAGAVSAVTAAIGVVPVHAGFGWLAETVGLTRSMLGVHLAVAVLLLRVVPWPPGRSGGR
ncbi:MFS transporter [Nitriliruptoraceae bacterium ZYF776]|nr:MFS transporter [Profundirhabdus halotolerans]